jgi:hypothetical protein
VLWHVTDNDEADSIINQLVDALPPGSYLAIAHRTLEVTGEKMAAAIRYWNEYGTPAGTHHTPAEIARFFDRLELVEPGVGSSPLWRPEPSQFGAPRRSISSARSTASPDASRHQTRRPI